jgi:amicyanin
MSGYAFGPRALTITAGDTVTWVNQDSAPHDVKITSGPESIHSPMLDKGATWSHTFTAAGSYGYVCTVHPGMTAQLVVKTAATRKPAPQSPAHQHSDPAPSPASPARKPAPATTSVHPHGTKSAAAAAPAPSNAAPSTPTDPGPPEVAADTARPLDPLLILAGVVAGVAVLCLLLVGSRSAAAVGQGGTAEG